MYNNYIMDKKIFKPNIKPIIRQNIKTYISEIKKDDIEIDNIYSIFMSSEYQQIIDVINSNRNLTFKNKEGYTLIHAILKNVVTELTEDNILSIIKMLIGRNVSINAMTEYNQNAVHFACIHGYIKIISYLHDLKCDFALIDNYGNSPIHYYIDKFVKECKKHDYAKDGNSIVKNSQHSKKQSTEDLINDIYMKSFYELTNNFYYETFLNNFIMNYSPDVNDILNNKKKEIIDLYNKVINEDFELKVSDVLYDLRTNIETLYKDFHDTEFEKLFSDYISHSIKSNNELNYDDILFNEDSLMDYFKSNINIEKLIEDNQANIDIFINQLYDNINAISNKINNLLKYYDNIYYLIYFIFYILILFSSNNLAYPTYNDNNNKNNITGWVVYNRTIADINNFDIADNIIYQLYFNIILPFYEFYVNTTDIRDFSNIIAPQLLNFNFDDNQNLTDRLRSIISTHMSNIKNNCNTNINIKRNYQKYQKDEESYAFGVYNIYLNGNRYIPILRNMDKIEKIDNYYTQLTLKKFSIPIDHTFNIYNNYVNILSAFKGNYAFLLQNRYFKYRNIYNYCIYINTNLICILQLLDQDFRNDKNKILFNICYSNIIYEFIINISNNLVLLKEAIDYFNLNKPNLIQLTKNLKFQFDRIANPEGIEFYKNNIEHYFNILIDKINEVRVMFAEEKHISDINDIYNILTINFFSTIEKIIDVINTHMSLKYMQQIINNPLPFNNNPPQPFTDFYNNPIKLNNFLPSSFNEYSVFFTNYHQTNDITNLFYKYKISNYRIYMNIAQPEQITGRNIVVNIPTGTITINNIIITLYNNTNPPYSNLLITGVHNKEDGHLNFIFNNTDIVNHAQFNYKVEPNITINNLDNIPLIIYNNKSLMIKILQFMYYSELYNINLNFFDNLNQQITNKLTNRYEIKLFENFNPANKNYFKNKMFFDLFNSYIKVDIQKYIDNNVRINIYTMLDEINDNNIKKQVIINLNRIIPEIISLEKKLKDINNILKITTDKQISTTNRIINNKCYDEQSINDFFERITYNLRTIDHNGNTILNKLIDNYNIYAIKKLLSKVPSIITYKNIKNQNAEEYTLQYIENLKFDYSQKELESRINIYAFNLNSILLNDENFNFIKLDLSSDFIQDIIINSIYLFIECLWLKSLEFLNGWTLSDKEKIKNLLIEKIPNITLEEILLIKTFNDMDNNYIINEINNSLDQKNDNDEEMHITALKNENIELEKLKNKTTPSSMLNVSNIDYKIGQNRNQINEYNRIIAAKNINYIDLDFKEYIERFVNMIDKFEIKFIDYNQCTLYGLNNNYIKIIRLLNKKNKDNKYISTFNILLFCLDYKNLNITDLKSIQKYFNNFIYKIYSDYTDLDLYENSDYNYINKYIIEIIKLNAQNIIIIEMVNAFKNYLYNFIQKDSIANYFNQIDVNYDLFDIAKPYYKKLYDICEELFKLVLINKIDNLMDPTKEYQKVNEVKKILINKIYFLFDITKDEEIDKNINVIIDFYCFVFENIAYNIYEEIIKLLNDSKKIGLLIDILLLIRETNTKI